jgi:hypothetical protein
MEMTALCNQRLGVAHLVCLRIHLTSGKVGTQLSIKCDDYFIYSTNMIFFLLHISTTHYHHQIHHQCYLHLQVLLHLFAVVSDPWHKIVLALTVLVVLLLLEDVAGFGFLDLAGVGLYQSLKMIVLRQ